MPAQAGQRFRKGDPTNSATGSHGRLLTCRVLRPPLGPEAGDGEQAALCEAPGEIPAHAKCEIHSQAQVKGFPASSLLMFVTK